MKITSRRGASADALLGAGQPGYDWSKPLHSLAWYHDVAETPPLASLNQALAQLIHASDEHNRKIERIFPSEAEHRCNLCRAAGARDDPDGKGRNLQLK
jgi:hypothetical protein